MGSTTLNQANFATNPETSASASEAAQNVETFQRSRGSYQYGRGNERGLELPSARVKSTGTSFVELSLAQFCTVGSVIAGCLFASFLLGLHAGREQGLSTALEEYSAQAVRLPLAEPLASESSMLATRTDLPTSAEVVSPSGADLNKGATTEKFDFSPEGKLSLPQVAAPTVEKNEPEQQALSTVSSDNVLPEQSVINPPKQKDKLAVGWYVQVAATKDEADLQRVVKKLMQKGYKPLNEPTEIRGQSFQRVLVGPYVSKDKAAEVKARLAKEKLTQGMPFLKRMS